MHTIGVLLLAAATAGDGFGYGSPGVGFKKLFRHHAVVNGPAPPGGPMMAGAYGTGCSFGHPGCAGGAACPGGGGAGAGGAGAGGAGGGGAGAGGRRFPNVRSQIYFLDPDTMKVGWQTGAGQERVYLPAQLTVPARYNFMQGYIYRLKLTEIPGRPGVQLYPTIEVAPSTPATDAYLTHNPIPVQFTAEDFDQVVDGGNFVTKVIYLPDPKYQELAIAGVETLVSTRLEPGVDPILEADKRGTILLIVRLGAIDLEMPPGGASVAPGTLPSVGPGSSTVLPPGTLPPGVVTTPPIESVPVDTNAPVSPVPPGTAPAAPPAATPPPPSPEPPAAAPAAAPAAPAEAPATPPAVPAPPAAAPPAPAAAPAEAPAAKP
jgi:hypothetical protein